MFYPTFGDNDAFLAYVETVNKLKQKIKTENKLPEKDIVTRMLLPEDVGFSNPCYLSTIAASATAAWSNMINTYTVVDQRYIAIFGVSYDNSQNNVVALRITRAGRIAKIWDIQKIADFEDKTGYVDDPVTIDQNTQLTIEKFARTTTDADRTTLIGVVVELRGLKTNP